MAATEQFVEVVETDFLDFGIAALFQRVYQTPPPDFPTHFLARVKVEGNDEPQLASYVHATDQGDVVLLGGACTDGAVLRQLSPVQQAHLRRIDGIYRYLMEVMQTRLRQRYKAMLACCGDARSEQVILDQGWRATPHQHLFVRWLQALGDDEKARIIERGKQLMPF